MSDYNFIYKKLVQSPNDVVGALAYALYKEEKIAYLTAFRDEKKIDPIDAELAEFHRITNVPQRIESYRQQAEGLLQEFLDDVLAAQLLAKEEQLKSELIARQIEGLAKDVVARTQSIEEAVKTKQSFWPGVRQNIVAGFATTLITFGFVLATWMWNEGPMNILQGAWAKYQGSPASVQPVK